jgi:hypothetical protein
LGVSDRWPIDGISGSVLRCWRFCWGRLVNQMNTWRPFLYFNHLHKQTLYIFTTDFHLKLPRSLWQHHLIKLYLK